MQSRLNEGPCGNFISEFTVAKSDDGEVWTDVDDGKVFDAGIKVCDGAHHKILFSSPVEAKYIKLILTEPKTRVWYKSGLLIVDPAVAEEEAEA